MTDIKQDLNNGKLIILRGLPSSGKSTLANQFSRNNLVTIDGVGQRAPIHSTDNFFLRPNGYYDFNHTLLSDAHKWNKNNVATHLALHVFVIVVDNTHTTYREIKPYLELANKYHYQVYLCIPSTEWRWSVEECFNRNSHGVPKDTIQKMMDRFESNGDIIAKAAQDFPGLFVGETE